MNLHWLYLLVLSKIEMRDNLLQMAYFMENGRLYILHCTISSRGYTFENGSMQMCQKPTISLFDFGLTFIFF